MIKTIFLTGSFGNAGEHILLHLLNMGYKVLCFDLKTPNNEKKEKRLAAQNSFETIWGDLRKEAQLNQQLLKHQPDIIIHNAAIIPPVTYLNPKLAQEVNVGGMKHLINSAKNLSHPPKFIFISSYSVHGYRNPHKQYPLLTGNTPVNPGDNYGKQKVAAENLLQATNLPWTIIRFPAVLGTDPNANQHPATMKFSFLLPLDRREHGIDVRDAGLAVANAVAADTIQQIFDIGGDESWKITGKQLMAALFKIRGLATLPDSAYRQADPAVDESWYYEDWIDTSHSQKVLNYQNHTFEDYLETLQKNVGFQRYFLKLMSPLISKKLLKDSPYYGKTPMVDSRPFWETVCEIFEVKVSDTLEVSDT